MSIELDDDSVAAIGPLCGEAVLNRLRGRVEIPAASVTALNRLPWIEYLRAEVRPDDRDWLVELVESPRQRHERGLAISLLCGLLSPDSFHSLLFHLWRDHAADYELRWELAPRLLDDPELPEDVGREIYAWVGANWARWCADAVAWYIGPDQVLPWIEARLKDARFPPSKAWLYLCIAATSSDQDGRRRIWESQRAHLNGFVSEVASDLLAHGRPALAGLSNA